MTQNVEIPGGTGRKRVHSSVQFASNVNRAAVTLNGFKVDFADADHHINIIEIDVDLGGHPAPPNEPAPPAIEGRRVRFTAECEYRDQNFDDAYSGYVTVTVLADRV